MAYEQLKDQIKQASIVDIIARYIPLSKKGANHEGVCPFHSDTKPSLKVNDVKGLYKCFACGAGGDAITFVKDFKHLEYVDTLRELANVLGLPFEEYQKEKKVDPKLEMSFRVLNAATKLYLKVAAEEPFRYVEFIQKRELDKEFLEKFQIGYAPHNSSLFEYLKTVPGKDRDFAISVAKELGLVREGKFEGNLYDFYRERVMFPIHDHQGQVRGFSSRAVLPDQMPKYLNSGESFAFKKGNILFGFYFAKNHIRQKQQVIIVEGNMDTVMMHQHGFTETVGTMGTAMSDQMCRLLANMSKTVYLAMDSDPAGIKAMNKVNEEFLTIGLIPKFIDFAPHKDPDDFLKVEGRIVLMERLEKAPFYVDWVIKNSIPHPLPENPNLKLDILNQIFEILAPLKENLLATERVIELAKTLEIRSDASTVLSMYKDYLAKRKEGPVRAAAPRVQQIQVEAETHQEENQEPVTPLEVFKPMGKSEKVFLKEILSHPESLTRSEMEEILAIIEHPEVKRFVYWLVNIYQEIDEAEYVTIVQDELNSGSYSKELIDVGTEALFQHSGLKLNEKVLSRMLKDYRLMLKVDYLKHKRREFVENQGQAHSQEEVQFYLGEISKIDKELLALKNTP
ncbi:MAG: DNA primase [Bacteriovoracaceae bacterium]